ncbi:MAG: hypothetical protein ACRDSP_22790 [Pseudonocardiaceae bacterium]
MRSEVEVRDLQAVFTATGDDAPTVNVAVRDTLQWVLGGFSGEELVEEYLAVGEEYRCFSCP